MVKVQKTDYKHTESLARCKMSDKETKCLTKLWFSQRFCLALLIRKLLQPLGLSFITSML